MGIISLFILSLSLNSCYHTPSKKRTFSSSPSSLLKVLMAQDAGAKRAETLLDADLQEKIKKPEKEIEPKEKINQKEEASDEPLLPPSEPKSKKKERYQKILSKLANQARFVPYIKKGRQIGYQIKDIKPKSFYTYLGFKEDDVILKIEGYPLRSPKDAIFIYYWLINAQKVTLDIRRKGKDIKKTVSRRAVFQAIERSLSDFKEP
jgi:hypothetical protein